MSVTQLASPAVPPAPPTQPAAPAPAPAPGPTPAAAGKLQRVFDKLRFIADRGWSGSAVFVYGVLQNLIVPGFADALYLPLALAQPKHAYRLAAFAIAGTVVGATLLFFLGGEALAVVSDTIGRWTGIDAGGLQKAQDLLTKYGWLLVIGSAFSPISTKLLAVSAGAYGMPYLVFIGSLAAARTARLLVFSWAIQKFGARAIREALGLRAEPTDEGLISVQTVVAPDEEIDVQTLAEPDKKTAVQTLAEPDEKTAVQTSPPRVRETP